MPEDCPLESVNCKYFKTVLGCHESTHHMYRRSEATTPLRRVYSNLGVHTMQLCRLIHDEVEHEIGGLPYPEPEVMLDVISSEVAIGHESLSATKKRKLGL